VALAAVTFNPDTGTGFVGKGDVQTVFGWNNATLQRNAAGVSFVYEEETTYAAVCTFITGEGTRGEQTHNVSQRKESNLSSSIQPDPRVRNQITGFNLLGITSTTTSGTVPEVDGACVVGANEGKYTSVTETGSSSGLFVRYLEGTPVKIWPAAVI